MAEPPIPEVGINEFRNKTGDSQSTTFDWLVSGIKTGKAGVPIRSEVFQLGDQKKWDVPKAKWRLEFYPAGFTEPTHASVYLTLQAPDAYAFTPDWNVYVNFSLNVLEPSAIPQPGVIPDEEADKKEKASGSKKKPEEPLILPDGRPAIKELAVSFSQLFTARKGEKTGYSWGKDKFILKEKMFSDDTRYYVVHPFDPEGDLEVGLEVLYMHVEITATHEVSFDPIESMGEVPGAWDPILRKHPPTGVYRYQWRLHNFDSMIRAIQPGQLIASSEFEDLKSNTRWQLVMFPNGTKKIPPSELENDPTKRTNHFSLYLQMAKGQPKKLVQSFQLRIWDNTVGDFSGTEASPGFSTSMTKLFSERPMKKVIRRDPGVPPEKRKKDDDGDGDKKKKTETEGGRLHGAPNFIKICDLLPKKAAGGDAGGGGRSRGRKKEEEVVVKPKKKEPLFVENDTAVFCVDMVPQIPVAIQASRGLLVPLFASSVCRSKSCNRMLPFDFMKVNCRACGDIFCSECAGCEIVFGNHFKYPPTAKQRTCQRCFDDMKLTKSISGTRWKNKWDPQVKHDVEEQDADAVINGKKQASESSGFAHCALDCQLNKKNHPAKGDPIKHDVGTQVSIFLWKADDQSDSMRCTGMVRKFYDPPPKQEPFYYEIDCGLEFSFTQRRHHCRYCGKLFCANCTAWQAPIYEMELESPQKVCLHCYDKLMDPETNTPKVPAPGILVAWNEWRAMSKKPPGGPFPYFMTKTVEEVEKKEKAADAVKKPKKEEEAEEEDADAAADEDKTFVQKYCGFLPFVEQ